MATRAVKLWEAALKQLAQLPADDQQQADLTAADIFSPLQTVQDFARLNNTSTVWSRVIDGLKVGQQ